MSRRSFAHFLLPVTLAIAGCGDGDGDGGRNVDVSPDGGRPGVDGGPRPDGGGPLPAGAGAFAISEIMYHPVGEEALEDEHEFLELHNRTAAPASLKGWRIDGEVKLALPDVTVPAKGYVVVAKNKKKLLEVKAYNLAADRVVGEYMGGLENGGGAIELRDPAGQLADSVKYDDGFPWPTAADALGAGDRWFPAGDPRADFSKHRHLGHSLERVSFDHPGTVVANWAPSKLDAPTPGAPNGAAGTPQAIVEALGTRAETGAAITKETAVKVGVRLSALGTVTAPVIEYFVDDVARTDEPVATAPLTRAADGTLEATIPAQPGRSIVRYRVKGDRGAGAEVISPRPTDPYAWHAYYVNPPAVGGETAVYELFIAPANWGKLWENILPGRVLEEGGQKCKPNPAWEDRVPAVFVHDGKVYDVLARYQGSGENRKGGVKFKEMFQGIGPTAGPDPMTALSWSFSFPRYSKFEKRSRVVLNKLTQACPGAITTLVASKMMVESRAPVQKVVRFARLYINGGYYHYMTDREQIDEDLLRRVSPKDPIGDLFKNVGFKADEGIFGHGDMRPLAPYCGFTAEQRYDATFERQTWEWKGGSGDVKALIDEFHAAHAADLPTGKWENLRKFFAERFDLDHLLTYRAIANWFLHWDDTYHNYFLYKRATDGKWMQVPYDFDYTFGGWWPEINGRTDISIYSDTEANPGLLKTWNHFTDGLLKAYRAEYDQKVRELSAPGKVLHVDTVAAIVDEAVKTSGYKQDEARQAPGGTACKEDFVMTGDKIKNWAKGRHNYVKTQLQIP